MRRSMLIPSLLLLGLLPGCTGGDESLSTAQSAEPAACFDVSRVSGWTVVDDRTVEVRVGAAERYRVELSGLVRAVGLRSVGQIGFAPNSSGDLCALGGFVLADGRRIPVETVTAIPADAPPKG